MIKKPIKKKKLQSRFSKPSPYWIRFFLTYSYFVRGDQVKFYCIVNPYAGKGKTEKLWPSIYKNLQKIGKEINFEFTQSKGHAKELARQATNSNYRGIITIGGDGTINEVINGIVGTNLPLGIIPTGSGNDLCKTLNIPLDPFEAIIVLAQGKDTEINIGEVDGRYFVNVGSVGFDAAVAKWVNNTNLFKNSLAYYLAIFYNIIRNKHYKLKINLDGKIIEKECTLVAVANGKYYGSGYKIAPYADLYDKLFDVVIVNAVSPVEIIKTLPGIKEGKHIENPNVNIYKAKKVIINNTKQKVPVQVDGEVLGSLPQQFIISDKSIKVFVP